MIALLVAGTVSGVFAVALTLSFAVGPLMASAVGFGLAFATGLVLFNGLAHRNE